MRINSVTLHFPCLVSKHNTCCHHCTTALIAQFACHPTLSSRVQKALIGLIHNKVRNQKSALKVNICVSVQQSVALLTKTNRLKQSGPQLFDLYHTVTKTIFRLKKYQNSNICKIFPRSEGALKISFWKSKVDFASVCSVRSAVKRNTLYVFRIKINFKKC